MAYTLKITEGPGRYTAQIDDRYELTGGAKKSAGRVGKVAGGGTVDVLTLEPDESSKTFTATVSGTRLTALNGWITWTDTTEVRGPGSLAVPPSADPSPSVPSYTITFDSNEGSEVAAITAKQGAKIDKPIPENAGFYFLGWFDETGETKYDVWPHTLTESVTMYAQWTEIPTYTITFNPHGGSAVAEITKPEGTEVEKPTDPTWDDYHTFKGWFPEASDAAYTWPHTLKGNIAMYAHWTVQQFTITFETHDGSSVTAITQDGGTTVNEPGEPTKSNHRFLGWFPEEDSGVKYTWSHTLTKSLTMHAQWIRQYTVTFDPHSGSAVTAITQDVNTTVDYEPVTNRGGYKFLGWFPTDSGGVKYTWSPYTITGDVTMHAQWKKLHLVTFHPLGGSPAPEAKTVVEGETVSVPEAMTRASGGMYTGAIDDVGSLNVTFVDWYTEPGYSTKWSFTDPVNTPLSLYAKWSQPVVDIYSQTGNNTIEKALNYIKAYPPGVSTNYTIVVEENFSMASTGSANINNANAVITLVGKGPSPTEISSTGADSLFYITAGKLVLDNNITLIGNSVKKNDYIGAVIRIDGASAFVTMNAGAVIRGNTGINGGGVNLAGGGTFTLDGGKITGNTAIVGGGVRVQYSTFIMKDGEISDNIATGETGGGVYIMASSTFNMERGKISGNTVTGTGMSVYGGGGVYISQSSFKKTGGYIGGDNDTTPYTPQNGNGTQDDNTVVKANNLGHAVCYAAGGAVWYYRNAALEDGSGGNIDTGAEKPANSGAGEKNNWTMK